VLRIEMPASEFRYEADLIQLFVNNNNSHRDGAVVVSLFAATCEVGQLFIVLPDNHVDDSVEKLGIFEILAFDI